MFFLNTRLILVTFFLLMNALALNSVASLADIAEEAKGIYQSMCAAMQDEAAALTEMQKQLKGLSNGKVREQYDDIMGTKGTATSASDKCAHLLIMYEGTLADKKTSLESMQSTIAFIEAHAGDLKELVNRFITMALVANIEKLDTRSDPRMAAQYPCTLPIEGAQGRTLYEQELIETTRRVWADEAEVMKLFVPLLHPEDLNALFGTLKLREKYRGHLTLLEAYIRDLVESPPFPDQWKYQLHQKTASQLAREIPVREGITQALFDKGQQYTTSMGRDGKKVKTSLLDLRLQTLELKKRKATSDLFCETFSYLGALEKEAVARLKKFSEGVFVPGQWRTIAAEEEQVRFAAKRLKAEKAKKKRAKAKAKAKAKKKALAAEKESVLQEEEVEGSFTEGSAFVEADDLEEEVESSFTEEGALIELDDHEDLSRIKKDFEDQVALDCLAKKGGPAEKKGAGPAEKKVKAPAKVVAFEVEEELAQEGAISLNKKTYALMADFWTVKHMKWDAFQKLFTKVGFQIKATKGSIRRFMRAATETDPRMVFTAHEPHESYHNNELGPNQLGYLRSLLADKMDWSLARFAEA